DIVPTRRVANMREAVATASGLAHPGDTVLLAPACASLDQYRDYQHRGQVFVDAVRSLTP
ncbi:MAG: UDP-N-acetylmuramoyl-L-alanine--D-glutamate ligase, partial [Gammaproteobacteria bacterium]|nr:UDP-N-acetylmuramoyl-L-alanine--D-glutamate ligase [Gammaproteobacteria bacterium]